MASRTLQSTIEISGVLSPSLQAAIKNAVGKLEEMSEETLAAAGAAEKLCAEISTQESVLKSLQKGYADFVVSGKESTDEAQTLADKIQELSGELDENRGTLQAAEKAAQRLAGTQGDTADAYTKLERKISSQENELATLRRQYANVALEQGESSDEARQLANRIDDLSGELKENRQKLKDADRAAQSLGETLEDAGEKAEDSSEGYTVLKDVIADLASDAIDKAVESFKELATEGDTALAKLEARTGATGDKMKGFEDVMYEVYNANYGESLGDVQEKLSAVIEMTDDLDNASLARVTKNAIALEDVFGFDVTESMRAVNSLMDQFGITSDEAFNLIVQGAQNGLNQNDDLLDTINEYSVQFKGAGYSADDMFNMLANGAESGTWSVDKLGDAVKEFNIRMSDGTANDYLEDLGVDVDKVMAQFNKGGPEAQKAIGTVMDAILECDDATLQYQAGVGLFGTMWEDLGADTVASLMDTEGAIQSTSDAMSKMDGAAYDTLESSLSKLGRTVKAEVVQPIAEKLIPVIQDAVDTVTEKAGPAVDWFIDNLPYIGVALGGVGAVITAMKWGSIVAGVGKAIEAFKGIGAALASIPGPVLIVIGIVAALAAGFAYMMKTNEGFREEMGALWEQLQGVFSELGGVIVNTLSQLAPLIAQVATTVLELFGQIAATVIPILLQLIIELLPVITSLLNILLPVFVQIVQAVLPVLLSVIQQLLPPILQIVQMVLPLLVQLIQTLLPVILQVIESVLPILLQIITALLPVIMQIVSAVLPILVEILNMLTPILSMVISLLQPILDLFVAIVAPILNLIMAAITPLINVLLNLITAVLKPIMPIIQAVAKVITAVLGNAIKQVQPIIQGLTKVFQGLIDFVSGVFSGNWKKAWDGIVKTFGGLWDSLVGIVKAPINGVIGLVNKAIGALNKVSVKIPDWVPEYGGQTFGVNIPKIPMLAAGGFTNGVSIAGEEAMEAVISFDSAYRDKNIGIWEKAGQLLGVLGTQEQGEGLTSKAGELLTLDDFSLGSLADGTNVVIYYDFSNFTWSPQFQATGSDDEDDLMARLRAHEAEFFDWLEEFIRMREVAQYA